jgi:hypothetical protein
VLLASGKRFFAWPSFAAFDFVDDADDASDDDSENIVYDDNYALDADDGSNENDDDIENNEDDANVENGEDNGDVNHYVNNVCNTYDEYIDNDENNVADVIHVDDQGEHAVACVRTSTCALIDSKSIGSPYRSDSLGRRWDTCTCPTPMRSSVLRTGAPRRDTPPQSSSGRRSALSAAEEPPRMEIRARAVASCDLGAGKGSARSASAFDPSLGGRSSESPSPCQPAQGAVARRCRRDSAHPKLLSTWYEVGHGRRASRSRDGCAFDAPPVPLASSV